ncbi:MAG: hypothetical protein JSW48_03660 [Betaproteobacteria bacterium]|nr:MAG: hypothetical protein JSW48_03660 [Betaproteobacteria bacterium]
MRPTKILTIVCAVCLCSGSVTAMAQNQPRGDRVFISELEGIWMNDAYIKALRTVRMPHRAAKQASPVVIAITRQGRSYPYVATDFDKAAFMMILALEPDIKANSYRLVLGEKNEPTSAEDVTYIWFKGQRDADRKFRKLAFQEVFIMDGKWADYEHVGMELGPVMNGLVLAGRYKDSDGREWSFTEQGQATFPEESFYYELSINDRKARCEYFEAEDLDAPGGISYYGYAWKAGKLQLFRADMKNDRVQCEAEPFAVLTPH